MLNKNQYEILQSCANDEEIFYYLFEEVNNKFINNIVTNAEELIKDIIYLINKGYLYCWRLNKNHKEKIVNSKINDNFNEFIGYNCKSFDEHIEKYGYGPYVFMISETGITECDKSKYDFYSE